MAVLRAAAFSSSVAATMPSTFFWFGQISTQTLNSMMVPSQAPMPIGPMPLRSRKASVNSGPSSAAPASHSPTASAVAESETLPRASRGASLMRLLWSAAGPAPRCHGAVPVSQLETAPWTAENGPRGSRVPKPQASGSRARPGANRGSACKRMGAGDEQAPQATFESVDAADEFGVKGHGGARGAATCKHKRNTWRESQVVSTPI